MGVQNEGARCYQHPAVYADSSGWALKPPTERSYETQFGTQNPGDNNNLGVSNEQNPYYQLSGAYTGPSRRALEQQDIMWNHRNDFPYGGSDHTMFPAVSMLHPNPSHLHVWRNCHLGSSEGVHNSTMPASLGPLGASERQICNHDLIRPPFLQKPHEALSAKRKRDNDEDEDEESIVVRRRASQTPQPDDPIPSDSAQTSPPISPTTWKLRNNARMRARILDRKGREVIVVTNSGSGVHFIDPRLLSAKTLKEKLRSCKRTVS